MDKLCDVGHVGQTQEKRTYKQKRGKFDHLKIMSNEHSDRNNCFRNKQTYKKTDNRWAIGGIDKYEHLITEYEKNPKKNISDIWKKNILLTNIFQQDTNF